MIYLFSFCIIKVLSKESSDPVDLSQSVVATDGQRLQVVLNTLGKVFKYSDK